MRAPLPKALRDLPVAHRALHDPAAGRVENSPAAIAAAIAAGYAIEIDLQPAADGTPMVFHDYDLGRLTGQPGPIRGRSVAELTNTRLTGSSDTIPTLAQVLDQVAGRVPLLIEIKDQHGQMGADTGGFEARVAKVLAGYDGPVAVMSFNPHSVAHFAAACPDLPVGLTTGSYDPEDYAPLSPAVCNHLREIPDFDPDLHSFISHEAGDLARPRVSQIKASGAAILCWTIRSPKAEAEARRIADNITFEGYAAPL
ncbi:glycerophosphodiester phosphodiesterase family protein [Paracoccus sp. p3-h83]|uniref:glycerophosphodiester phosphodiesterase family protein n=1 Tax=Paracoccus sp. p3-h83 TaxID=3342805 RepID=UPI0035BA1D0B